MSNKTCGECKFYCNDAAFCSHYGVGWKKKTDMVCKNFEPIPKPTVFQKITASPEVLAEKLVYRSFIRRKEIRGNGLFLEIAPIKIKCYKSKVIPGVHYKNSTDASAATVAKLKEVFDE